MSEPPPGDPPVALTIASSDSGGGAGIQADLKTMTRFGVYGASAVVSTTAQNTAGVADVHVVPMDHLRAQVRAVLEDLPVQAVKLGMLATAEAVETVRELLEPVEAPIVIDPVMIASSGDPLLEPAAEPAYERLIDHARIVTPNADETEALTGRWPDSDPARADAAEQFFGWGAEAVLFKGGHLDGATVRDHLVTPARTTSFEAPRIADATTHGSGCTLSSAIAAGLARGEPLADACERGIEFVRAAIETPARVGQRGSVNHLVAGDPWASSS